MKFHIPLEFTVVGTPKRHRNEKTTTAYSWVDIELPEVDQIDAPVALRLENTGNRLEEVRLIDGEFWYPNNRISPLTSEHLGAFYGQAVRNEPFDIRASMFVGERLSEKIRHDEIKEFSADSYKPDFDTDKESYLRTLHKRIDNCVVIDGVVWERREKPVLVWQKDVTGDRLIIEPMDSQLANTVYHVFSPTACSAEIAEIVTDLEGCSIDIEEEVEVISPEALDYDIEEREFLLKTKLMNTDLWERSINFYSESQGVFREYGRTYRAANRRQLIAMTELADLLDSAEDGADVISEVEDCLEEIVDSYDAKDQPRVGSRIDAMARTLQRWRSRELSPDFSAAPGRM